MNFVFDLQLAGDIDSPEYNEKFIREKRDVIIGFVQGREVNFNSFDAAIGDLASALLWSDRHEYESLSKDGASRWSVASTLFENFIELRVHEAILVCCSEHLITENSREILCRILSFFLLLMDNLVHQEYLLLSNNFLASLMTLPFLRSLLMSESPDTELRSYFLKLGKACLFRMKNREFLALIITVSSSQSCIESCPIVDCIVQVAKSRLENKDPFVRNLERNLLILFLQVPNAPFVAFFESTYLYPWLRAIAGRDLYRDLNAYLRNPNQDTIADYHESLLFLSEDLAPCLTPNYRFLLQELLYDHFSVTIIENTACHSVVFAIGLWMRMFSDPNLYCFVTLQFDDLFERTFDPLYRRLWDDFDFFNSYLEFILFPNLHKGPFAPSSHLIKLCLRWMDLGKEQLKLSNWLALLSLCKLEKNGLFDLFKSIARLVLDALDEDNVELFCMRPFAPHLDKFEEKDEAAFLNSACRQESSSRKFETLPMYPMELFELLLHLDSCLKYDEKYRGREGNSMQDFHTWLSQ